MAKEKGSKSKGTGAKSAANGRIKYPAKFTAQTMLQYVSEKHDIPRTKAKEILEDVFDVIHAGVVKGERVPVGKFGKLYIKLKPATKARLGRNPITGEEIMIAAKKATKVPKFTFSKSYKDLALKAAVKSK
jgi:DNA-binding protein HU-beta